MKILIISARYPPHHLGGYEIRCKDIVDGLSRRGHEILVVTSRKEVAARSHDLIPEYIVLRNLHVRSSANNLINKLTRWQPTHLFGLLLTFVREILFDVQDLAFIHRHIQQFRPDVIYLAHITCLSRSILPFLAQDLLPILYDEGGSGLIDAWEEKSIWYKFVDEFIPTFSSLAAIKSLVINTIVVISKNRLKAQHVWPARMQIIFNSSLNINNAITKGVPVTGAKIIHSGIDTDIFSFRPRSILSQPIKILIPGRIEHRKGQKEAVSLLMKARDQGIEANVLFVGEHSSNSYLLDIQHEITEFHLEDEIAFLPMVERNKLIDLYHQADICFFPSQHFSGFSRIPVEAMACGCIVISYGNEGSDEIVRDGQTGFLVKPDDYHKIVLIIREMISNPRLVIQITSNARSEIESNYSMQKYVDQIEQIIITAVENDPSYKNPSL